MAEQAGMSEPTKDPSNPGDRELEEFKELPEETKKLMKLKEDAQRSSGEEKLDAQEEIDKES